MQETDWKCVLDSRDPNHKWETVFCRIEELMDQMCPIKKIKMRDDQDPWITGEIIESIKLKEKLGKKARLTSKIDDINSYKIARRKPLRLVRHAKTTYIEEQASTCGDDSKTF